MKGGLAELASGVPLFASESSPARIWEILDRICAALTDTIADIEAYTIERPRFRDIGARMIALWLKGMPKVGAS